MAGQQNHHNRKQPRLTLPFQTRVRLFFLNAVTNASIRPDATVNRRLFGALSSPMKVPATSKPRNGVSTSDVSVDSSRDLWIRLYVPTGSGPDPDPQPVIVFFHGGGFVYLSPDFKAYDEVCRRFARKLNAVIVSVNYRLAPEHKCPAQYDDGFDVLKFLDGSTSDVLPEKADVSRCFVAGDSAGGNLAHHVARRACESGFSHVKVVGVLAIQPFFGGEEQTPAEIELEGVDPIVSMKRSELMWKAFLPEGEDRDHEAVNVSGPKAADISNLDFPATMVVVAGFDSLKDWQRRYYQGLKKCGKEAYLLEYPNTIHAFYLFPELPESALFISEAKLFIQRQCSKL